MATNSNTERRAYASELRSMIQHENQLTHNRMGWMFVFQGLLFVALKESQNGWMVAVIAIAGMATAVSFGLMLEASYHSRQDLKDRWKEREGDDLIAPVHAGAPKISPAGGVISSWLWSRIQPLHLWLFPWRVLPVVFTIGWALLWATWDC